MSVDRYRLITPPDPEWVVFPAYACSNVARAQEIIAQVPHAESGAPIKIVDSRTGEVFLAHPGSTNFDATRIGSGPSASWKRHLFLNMHAPSSHLCLLLKSGQGQLAPRPSSGDLEVAPRWLRPILRHPIDCFPVWEAASERRGLSTITAMHRPQRGSPTPVKFLTGHKARGVLYARGYQYDLVTGEPIGVVVRILLITAYVHWGRSMGFHADFERHILMAPLAKDGSFEEPSGDFIEPCWTPLIDAARAGFAEFCAIEQPDCRWRRTFFIDQIDKEDADAKLNGAGFRGKVERMACADALTLANEAWKLGIVADVHAGAFVTAPKQTYGQAVEAMLAAHVCGDKRRAHLLQMKDDYLAFASEGWNKPFDEAFLT